MIAIQNGVVSLSSHRGSHISDIIYAPCYSNRKQTAGKWKTTIFRCRFFLWNSDFRKKVYQLTQFLCKRYTVSVVKKVSLCYCSCNLTVRLYLGSFDNCHFRKPNGYTIKIFCLVALYWFISFHSLAVCVLYRLLDFCSLSWRRINWLQFQLTTQTTNSFVYTDAKCCRTRSSNITVM